MLSLSGGFFANRICTAWDCRSAELNASKLHLIFSLLATWYRGKHCRHTKCESPPNSFSLVVDAMVHVVVVAILKHDGDVDVVVIVVAVVDFLLHVFAVKVIVYVFQIVAVVRSTVFAALS